MTDLTIELKLSSNNTMDDAYLATSVPDLPIAKPTSAFLRAGASLVPSPVTATIFPKLIKPVTRAYLSYGRDLANTSKCFVNLANYYSFLITSFLSIFFLSFISVVQSHFSVLQFAQTIPPIILLN